jgi:hypothetical protein
MLTQPTQHARSLKPPKKPVVLKKSVNGFLVNRLQYALLQEAWRLVEVSFWRKAGARARIRLAAPPTGFLPCYNSRTASPPPKMWTVPFLTALACGGRSWGLSRRSSSTHPVREDGRKSERQSERGHSLTTHLSSPPLTRRHN